MSSSKKPVRTKAAYTKPSSKPSSSKADPESAESKFGNAPFPCAPYPPSIPYPGVKPISPGSRAKIRDPNSEEYKRRLADLKSKYHYKIPLHKGPRVFHPKPGPTQEQIEKDREELRKCEERAKAERWESAQQDWKYGFPGSGFDEELIPPEIRHTPRDAKRDRQLARDKERAKRKEKR